MLKVSAHDAALGVFAATLIFVVLFWRLGTPTFYEREGMWATSGRALWRTYTPLTRFVVFSAARE
jgi:hypothetical protein